MISQSITMNGLPAVVSGAVLQVGEKAPAFQLVGNSLEPVTLDRFAGKVCVISCVPSVDTPVCSLDTRRFNQEAAALPEEVVILTVSRDLPFAQARWCAANGVKNVVMASDYRNFGFAQNYGVLLEDLGLLTRAVFIVDKQGIIRYIQFVPEVTQEPDYQTVLLEIKKCL